MRRRARIAIAGLALAATMCGQQVSYERLVNALKEQQNWLTYWGDYSAVRHRGLNQINTGNVKDLRVDWIFQTGQTGAFETTPLVVDGIMYITGTDGYAYALDARNGRKLWMYKHTFPQGRKATAVNRGFAILGDRLFMVTPDANVVALEAKTGKLIWQTEMAAYNRASTPLRSRRSPSRTRSSSGFRAPNTASVDSSTLMTPRQANAPGASGAFRPRENPAAIAGPPIPGSAAAVPPG